MSGRRACPPLGGDGASSVARRYLRDVGADWDDELLESALLATSEVVTNATLHGGDVSELDVHTSTETIRVEVYDSGCTPAAWLDPTGVRSGDAAGTRPVDDLSPGGRGLHIVQTLSQRWGVTQRPPGKVVWFELSTDRSSHGAYGRSTDRLAQALLHGDQSREP